MPLWRSSKVSEDCLFIVAGPFPYEYRPSEHYRPGPPLGFRVESSGHARMIWGSTQVTCPTSCRRESISFVLRVESPREHPTEQQRHVSAGGYRTAGRAKSSFERGRDTPRGQKTCSAPKTLAPITDDSVTSGWSLPIGGCRLSRTSQADSFGRSERSAQPS